MPSPFHRFVRSVLDNPLLDRMRSSLPDGVREAVGEVASAFRETPTRDEHRVLREAVEDGDVARGVTALLHDVRAGGTARGVNVLHGDVDGGVVKGCNVIDGDVRDGDVGAVNALHGDVYAGRVAHVNVIAGDVHGGEVRGVNLLLGDVRGGEVHGVHVLVGDVYDGRVRDCAFLVGDVHGGSVRVGHHVGEVRGGESESEDAEEPRDGAGSEPGETGGDRGDG